ncbi:MAG: acyl--CoA ligase [Oscillospiraceae bacterium]|jgi:long-chain acyl-CoA synthetase|nr:acyl--CoA ligase [Oscillospiraceae bacterium]
MIRELLLNQTHWAKTAVIDGDDTLTYGQLAQRAAGICAQLPTDGGNIVAVFLPNSADYLAALFGILMGGLTVFPLSITLTEPEIAALLAQLNVQTVVTTKEHWSMFNSLDNPPKILCVEDIAPCAVEALASVPATAPGTPMVLLSTSGTYGKAKIVMLSEQNMVTCVQNHLDKMAHEKCEEEIRYLLCTPFSSAYGMFILLFLALEGYTLVLMRETFTLDAFYRTIARYKVTHSETGTAAITLMAQNAWREIPYDITSARWYGFGGSGISKELLGQLRTSFPWAEFWPGYGMTETSPMVSKVNQHLPTSKLASVGTAVKSMTIMVEVDGVRTNAPFVQGEVVVKGTNVMLGYYENEAETAKMIRDGWLHTGDVGYLDEEKYLYICGRIKNIILVRGFTVYAEEVEACILSSGLAQACVVYGKPDGAGNEKVCAEIVPIAPGVTAESIQAWCSSHLAAYKCPQELILKDALDKTATEKVKRL